MTEGRYTFWLPDSEVVEVFAGSDAEAAARLEELRPGTSGQVVRLEREPRLPELEASR